MNTTPTITSLEADRFLNAIVNDAVEEHSGVSGGAPLQAIITDLLRPNSAADPDFSTASRQAAAAKLIESFGQLGNGPMPQDMQQMIKDVFEDPSLASAEAMAQKIRNTDFTNTFISLIGTHNLDYSNVLDDSIMTMMSAMFPELAGFLEDLGLGRNPHTSDSEQRMEDSLSEGWEAWQNGKVHNFNEIETVTGNTEDVIHRRWIAPTNEHSINEFFETGAPTTHSGGMWGSDEQYKFTDADPSPTPNTFAGMILGKWERDGVVKFEGTDEEIEAARAAFVERSHALAVGGQLDGTFADTLVDRNVVSFDNAGDRQAFIDHMTAWRNEDGGQYRDAQEIMQEVIRYVEANGGADWVDPDFSDETETQFSTTQTQVYRVAQQYAITRDGADYAEQMQRFAEEHPHIEIGAPPPPTNGGPRASQGDPDAEPPADPNQIKVARFDDTEGAGFLDYGDEIVGDLDASTLSFTANDGTEIFKFDSDFVVYGVGLETTAAGGEALTMQAMDLNGRTPQEVLESLGDDFKVRVVAHQDDGMDVEDSELLGFYVESADGQTSFYVGPSAIEEGSMTAEGKTELVKGIEQTPGVDTTAPDYDVTADANNSASRANNSGLGTPDGGITVDGQQDNTTVFQP